MQNAFLLQPGVNVETLDHGNQPSNANLSGIVLPFQSPTGRVEPADQRSCRQLVSTKELSEIWGVPESTLRYWRCAEIGPTYVKLGGRIKYDLADVERYVRANKRMPSVRAHGG
ncbi:MAG: helix-turn-helix transcriptional regulator [Terriglobales bacterium]